MLIEDQKIKTKIGGKTIKHYKELGYQATCREEIVVPINHLPKTSHEHVNIMCDRCGDIFDREYRCYLDLHKRRGGDFCYRCSNETTRAQTCLERYGVSNPGQSEAVREKMKKTCLERYGVENVSSREETKQKKMRTCYKNYGVRCGLLVPGAREKLKESNRKKYGTDYPFQSDMFWEKYFENREILDSKQQKSLYDKLTENNYFPKYNVIVDRCILDIVVELNNAKINIEYDGWYWHQDQQKDRRRDEFLKQKGYKILRIKGGHKLPDDTEFFNAINKLAHNDHSYKEIILSDWKEGESA